jgi:Prokaryotic homologs of the JAB domain
MLVCSRSLIFMDSHRGEIRYKAGEDYVSEDSDAARAHPDCFKPAPGRRPGARSERIYVYGGNVRGQAVRDTSELLADLLHESEWLRTVELAKARLSPPKCDPIRQPESGAPKVAISPAAHAAMRAWSLRASDVGREDGGLLLTPYARTETIEIVEACQSGKNAVRTANGFQFDRQWDHCLIEAGRELGLQPVGQWHTHRQTAEPSQRDLQAWETLRCYWSAPRFVGLILARDEWGCLVEVSATVVDESGASRAQLS